MRAAFGKAWSLLPEGQPPAQHRVRGAVKVALADYDASGVRNPGKARCWRCRCSLSVGTGTWVVARRRLLSLCQPPVDLEVGRVAVSGTW
jgi:hypothetical protein